MISEPTAARSVLRPDHEDADDAADDDRKAEADGRTAEGHANRGDEIAGDQLLPQFAEHGQRRRQQPGRLPAAQVHELPQAEGNEQGDELRPGGRDDPAQTWHSAKARDLQRVEAGQLRLEPIGGGGLGERPNESHADGPARSAARRS